MHEWHSNTHTNPFTLINQFLGFSFETDYSGVCEVESVKFSDRTFTSVDAARTHVTEASYCTNTAYMATVIPKKPSKAFQNAYLSFLTKYKEYVAFDKNLTISYGRKSSKVTCPHCGSSISLKYGGSYKTCPICGSRKIISDSNWKALETKRKLCEKAAEVVSKAAQKDNIVFVCGIEWHC